MKHRLLSVLLVVLLIVSLIGCGKSGAETPGETQQPQATKEIVYQADSFDLDKEADAVEEAVRQVLKDGYRTVDIMAEGCKKVCCSEMGTLLAERV